MAERCFVRSEVHQRLGGGACKEPSLSRGPFRRDRCLIVADGFCQREKKVGAMMQAPIPFTRPEDTLFALAALTD
ncbi:MAG TPA: hypothetical protein VK137_03825, partial [Planctomycetaceae bacterium]|nr:hypothetical protein [Planctomycetaceae bacterium]